MDADVKAQITSLSNRISGLKTRLKGAPEDPELLSRLAALESEREALRGPKKEKVEPSRPPMTRDVEDELGARRALASALTRQTGEDTPEIAKLIKHAERYGTTEIVQTAIDLGYGLDACVRLQDACDRIDAATHRKAHPHAPAMRFGPSEERVRALMPKEDDVA